MDLGPGKPVLPHRMKRPMRETHAISVRLTPGTGLKATKFLILLMASNMLIDGVGGNVGSTEH